MYYQINRMQPHCSSNTDGVSGFFVGLNTIVPNSEEENLPALNIKLEKVL